MLPTKYLLSDHWEFMGIRKTKTSFAENLKSVAQEIGIRDVSVCSPVCRSVAPSWLIPDPSVDLKFEYKQIKDVRGCSERDRSLAATSMGRPSTHLR